MPEFDLNILPLRFDQPGSSMHLPPQDGWQKQRDELAAMVRLNAIPDVSATEIDLHMAGMPQRYWKQLTGAEVIWDLQVVHEYFAKKESRNKSGAAVVVAFRNYPQEGTTKVVICTQDRVGLLAQLAGYFSALRLNIQKAEIYTREDGVALDVFWIRDDERGVIEVARLKHLTFLIEGRLEDPPRFASTWISQSHRFAPRAEKHTPVIGIDNESASDFTIVSIAAFERLGLLHDIVEVFTNLQLNIVDAQINTIGTAAHDVLLVTELDHRKMRSPARLEELQRALTEAIS